MNAYEIIQKKRRGIKLTKDEIAYMVNGYVSDEIPDYQMSAFLMAVCFQSLDDDETAALTLSMIKSGRTYNIHSDVGGICIDKHSTGGVGDKATLVVAPICAACGVYIPKMSGRGLGHTGGTIDKLESIPGFRTNITHEQFVKIVRETGFSVMSQTGDLVPADKKIYALRDLTATVDSIPLICSSIMSKKLAIGADGIVLDVKVGSGAFMKNTQDARSLAQSMLGLAQKFKRKAVAVLTDMDKPLGRAVGNAIEVQEACDVLKGKAKGDLLTVSLSLASHVLMLAGMGSAESCTAQAQRVIESGRAFECLERSVTLQGGNAQALTKYSLMGKPADSYVVTSTRTGYINAIDAERTGLAALALGAGRKRKNDPVDHSAGIKFLRQYGDYVSEGEEIAILYTSSKADMEQIGAEFEQTVSISPSRPERRPVVIEEITS
ncbi:MAG: thymidine phosphorylase [Oscillospiraceae bacterium]|nr:thymidine phosphorylase [Oscillospiraceae bacterium]